MTDRYPLPDVEWETTRPFWQAAAREVVAIPRCAGCGAFCWYPAPRCRHCGGERLDWIDLSGRGRLFSWSVVRRPLARVFRDQVPFVPALVSLAEAPEVRLVTRIVDCDPEALRPDQPVHAVFRELVFPDVADRVVAPLFTPDA